MSGGTFPKYPIVSQQILNASDDETLGPWIDVRGCANVTFYCLGTGTTSSGVISFEEAAPADLSLTVDPPVYGAATGNYSVMTTQNASTLSGGVQVAVHISSAAYYFVRARISTAIGGGGTVSVGLVAY